MLSRNSKRLIIGLTLLFLGTSLSGCGSSGSGSVAFSALTSGDGTGSFVSFNLPSNLTLLGNNLYVIDYGSDTVRKVTMASGLVSTIAGSKGVVGSSDGTGSAARFNQPLGITNDGINLYVADSSNNTIRKVELASGKVTTLAGSTIGKSGHDDGVGTQAKFNYPRGIVTDGKYLYVTDAKNHTIRTIEISTGTVTTLAGSAETPGSVDGVGTAARFNAPRGIATDGNYLYVAEEKNCTIRKIEISSGTVTTLAGEAGNVTETDGTGSLARFNQPSGLTTDGINLYVADAGGNTIRQVVIETGTVTTLAGSGRSGTSDGTGTAAQFNGLNDIVTDGTFLYVADTNNNTIRKVNIVSGEVTTFPGIAAL